MSQNKHQKQHPCDRQCKHNDWGMPVIEIGERITVTLPLEEYEALVRVAERAEAVVRYINSCEYGSDDDTVLAILDHDAEEGGAEE